MERQYIGTYATLDFALSKLSQNAKDMARMVIQEMVKQCTEVDINFYPLISLKTTVSTAVNMDSEVEELRNLDCHGRMFNVLDMRDSKNPQFEREYVIEWCGQLKSAGGQLVIPIYDGGE